MAGEPLLDADYTNSLNKFRDDHTEVVCDFTPHDTVILNGKRRTGKAFLMRAVLEQQRRLLAYPYRAKL